MTTLPPLPNAGSVRQQHFAIMPLPEPYAALLGKLPRIEQFSILIFGKKGTRKSRLALKLAQLFTSLTNKRLLYNTNEEPAGKGTLTLRLQTLGIHDNRIEFLNSQISVDLVSYLETGNYAYCFVDSINNLDVPDTDILNLQYRFPHVSFVFISQVNKSGNAKANEALQHMVDGVYQIKKNPKTGESTIHVEKTRYEATMLEINMSNI
jgi:predicted ATP-dependent serine protease